jgi:NAD(P)-dependent dehydrogenase (short-subunit alcohol dehydrogenase family)
LDIRRKTVLILGGYGLVGQAVARRLVREEPGRMVLLSLRREEAEEAVAAISPEARDVPLEAAWGDVFVFTDVKDRPRRETFADPSHRARVIDSLLDPLSEAAAAQYYLYQLITTLRPDIIVDAVNTATGIAYQDIYKTSQKAWQALREGTDLRESVETLLVTDYVPQLIRHVQVLYQAMLKAGTGAYVKIGTSGTAGWGSTSLTRTPRRGRPGWSSRRAPWPGRTRCCSSSWPARPAAPSSRRSSPPRPSPGSGSATARSCAPGGPCPSTTWPSRRPRPWSPAAPSAPLDPARGQPTGESLKSVFIDTGENGIFSLEEFSAITTGEQMEFVTPEEIADVVARELLGGNTGHDIINALDNAVMDPTYRAGLMRHRALEMLRALEERHRVRSVAFENLGPPRLSKLLFEADLLRRAFSTMDRVRAATRRTSSAGARRQVEGDAALRREIVSIGIPILLPDGRLLRGPECRIPPVAGPGETREVTPERVEAWAHSGWVDLRAANMARWKERFERIRAETDGIPPADSSSRFLRDRQFWGQEGKIQPGKVVGWIFATEEKGARMK